LTERRPRFRRSLIVDRDDAEARVREASEAETRARQIMYSARMRLHKLESVDEAVHLHRVDALKAHALDPSGGAPSLEIPPKLAEHVRERDLARDEARAAAAAHEQLEKDVMLEKEALRRAEEQVRSAAKLVAIEDGEALVEELNQVVRRALALRDELGAMTGVVAPGEQWATGRLPLSLGKSSIASKSPSIIARCCPARRLMAPARRGAGPAFWKGSSATRMRGDEGYWPRLPRMGPPYD
jgi:hypothetical protein